MAFTRDEIIGALRIHLESEAVIKPAADYVVWSIGKFGVSRATAFRYVKAAMDSIDPGRPRKPPTNLGPPPGEPRPGPDREIMQAVLPPPPNAVQPERTYESIDVLAKIVEIFDDLDVIRNGLRKTQPDGSVKIANAHMMHSNIRHRVEAVKVMQESIEMTLGHERTRELWLTVMAAIGRGSPETQRAIVRELRKTSNLMPALMPGGDVEEAAITQR